MNKIMVIDDDKMILRMAEFMLKKKGYDVVTALSGSEGLDILRSEGADLVLLDVEMPQLSGIDVLKLIREDSSIGSTKVCLMTGTKTEETQQAVSLYGACGCIGKPLAAAELFSVLETEI